MFNILSYLLIYFARFKSLSLSTYPFNANWWQIKMVKIFLLVTVNNLTLFFWTLRPFSIHLQHGYNLTISEIAWRVNINPNEFYNNWYYKNNKKYGNPIWYIGITRNDSSFLWKRSNVVINSYLAFLSFPLIITLMVFIKLHSKG